MTHLHAKTIDFLRIFTIAVASIGVVQTAKADDAFFAAKLGPNNLGDFDLTLSFNHNSFTPDTSPFTFDPTLASTTPPAGWNNDFSNWNIKVPDTFGHGSDFRILLSGFNYPSLDGVYGISLFTAIFGSCEAAQDTCADIVGTATLVPKDELVNIPGRPTKLSSTKVTTEKVPAPLPILGVAAALGSLKKLKKFSQFQRNMSPSSLAS